MKAPQRNQTNSKKNKSPELPERYRGKVSIESTRQFSKRNTG